MYFTIISTFSAIFVCIYLYFKHCYSYWGRKGVEVVFPPTIPVGNLGKLLLGQSTSAQIFTDIYKACKGRFAGFYLFNDPGLVIKDPELIKNILTKDFESFRNRPWGADFKVNYIFRNITVLRDDEWKNLRAKLTPTFTSGKLKMMFPVIVNCGVELQKALQIMAEKQMDVEIKDYVARYTTDTIASIAFGIETNSLRNPETEFRKHGKKLFDIGFIQSLRYGLFFAYPKLMTMLKLRLIDKETSDFFFNAVKETVEYREKNNVTRNDFLQLLIELKNKEKIQSDVASSQNNGYENLQDTLTMEQISAQILVIFVGGFETSSSAMNFCLYELALNPEMQTKLQNEIDTITKKYDGKLTYDSISEMTYLENVVAESLRKYPIGDILNRECSNNYKIPNSDVVIEKGTHITISVLGLHHDEEHFINPEKFDPDRFLPENKTWNPYCYLPFGVGPRHCIGERMGRLQIKVGVVSILSKFNVNVCEKTPIPMTFSKRHFVLTPEKNVYLKVTARDNV